MRTVTQRTAQRNGSGTTKPVITSDVLTITPAMAMEMLEGNLVNRKPRKGRIDLYAKQMVAGHWRVTGETIVFSPTGQLLQGQHRLLACVQANVPFTTIVVRGVAPEAMRVMDTGLSRTASDVFGFEGFSGGSTVEAATTKNIIAVKGEYPLNTSRIALITRDELVDFYGENAELIAAAVQVSGATYSALRHSRGGWATLAFLLLEVDPELASEFFRGLGSGASMSDGDARLALRAYCLTATQARRRMTWPEIVANGIRVWNSWIDDKRVTHIKGWKPVNAWPEINA